MNTNGTSKAGGRLKALAELVFIAGIGLLAANLLFADGRLTSDAMSPSFQAGERVLALRLPYLLASPQRGDLVIAREPQTNTPVLRRVVGLPGEKINARGRQILVNDAVLSEPYVSTAPAGETINFTGEFKLQADEYLVLSDSRETQTGFSDGRSWGAISSGRILGRAFLVYWPLSDMRMAE